MRPRTVRRVVAGTVVVALITLGAAAFLSTSGEPDVPRWKGPALDATRPTSTEIVVEPVTVDHPEQVAAAAMGSKKPSFDIAAAGSQTTYTDGDLSVRVRTGTPVRLTGRRPAAQGALPTPEQALKIANDTLKAFGLDPADWSVTQKDVADFRNVTYDPRADLPIFAAGGVETPRIAFAIDQAGVRSFSATLARLTTRPVTLISQQEAFPRVDRAGKYVSVRLVLVDRGNGRISPHWEFKDEAGKLFPVSAVLTA